MGFLIIDRAFGEAVVAIGNKAVCRFAGLPRNDGTVYGRRDRDS